jgi:hypothetical protein
VLLGFLGLLELVGLLWFRYRANVSFILMLCFQILQMLASFFISDWDIRDIGYNRGSRITME